MSEVIFDYKLEKDIQNFLRGTRSKNNLRPTSLQAEYIKKYGTVYSEEKVSVFLKKFQGSTHFDPVEVCQRFARQWRPCENEFFDRANALFKITFPLSSIAAYISTNQRCTYRISDDLFFIYAQSPSANKIIMHEIFHFYTWYAFQQSLSDALASETEYNVIKESLTELLNLEFLDLMPGAVDEGYPQHAKVRKRIRQTWLQTHDLNTAVSESLAMIREGISV